MNHRLLPAPLRAECPLAAGGLFVFVRQPQFDVVFLQPSPDVRPQFPGELDQLVGLLWGRAACVVVFATS